MLHYWHKKQSTSFKVHDNIYDHEQCHEVQAQAVSYTTGVPAMIGAEVVSNGQAQGI